MTSLFTKQAKEKREYKSGSGGDEVRLVGRPLDESAESGEDINRL